MIFIKFKETKFHVMHWQMFIYIHIYIYNLQQVERMYNDWHIFLPISKFPNTLRHGSSVLYGILSFSPINAHAFGPKPRSMVKFLLSVVGLYGLHWCFRPTSVDSIIFFFFLNNETRQGCHWIKWIVTTLSTK